MAHDPVPRIEEPAEARPRLELAPPRPDLSRWEQPRDVDGQYVRIGRRALPALTSLRFFAAFFVVVHHLINLGLLATQGADADRTATWWLAWGTQGHVGVTFFFVLSGFILAWCYHEAYATIEQSRIAATSRRFWRARWARVWPLHAAMFLVVLPIAVLELSGIKSAANMAWQALANLFLLHAWIPWAGRDGLAQTFNGPSWTLSCEAFFYAIFPALAILALRRFRVGTAQLAIAALGTWVLLGVVGVAVGDSDRAIWFMHVFPLTRAADFVIGVALGLVVVQGIQRRVLRSPDAPTPPTTHAWTAIEVGVIVAACLSPLAWSIGAHEVLPETLGSSWFHLPTIVLAIGVISLERGALSRRLLAWSPLVWLGEISYALYLTHMVLLIAAFRVGLYDRLGVLVTSALLIAVAIAVAGVVHERFEKPVRARLVGRRT